jgi:hypothetical protein
LISTRDCNEAEILDVVQIKGKNFAGKKVVKEVIKTYCALAIKFKGLFAVALIGDESKFWVAKPV